MLAGHSPPRTSASSCTPEAEELRLKQSGTVGWERSPRPRRRVEGAARSSRSDTVRDRGDPPSYEEGDEAIGQSAESYLIACTTSMI